jgi:hypothetical protein
VVPSGQLYFLHLSRKEQGIITNVGGSSRKVSAILIQFQQNLQTIIKISQHFMKIHPAEAELFHANRQADRYMTKLTAAFGNYFANAHNKNV